MLAEKNFQIILGWIGEYWAVHDRLSETRRDEAIWELSIKVCDMYPRYPRKYLYNLGVTEFEDMYVYWLMALRKTFDYMKRKEFRAARPNAIFEIAMRRLRDVLIECKYMKRNGRVILEEFTADIDETADNRREHRKHSMRVGKGGYNKTSWQETLDQTTYNPEMMQDVHIDLGLPYQDPYGYAGVYYQNLRDNDKKSADLKEE